MHTPESLFSQGLLDPGFELPAGLTVHARLATGHRYDIYRNNIMVSLIEALGAVFPAVRHITGEDFFRAMARSHIRATPPKSPLLFEYGRDLPAYIEHYEYARPVPWLADVARIERAWLDAYHAPNAPTLSARRLAAVQPEALSGTTFKTHPATHIVRSNYNAFALFAAHRNPDIPETAATESPQATLITRPDIEVCLQRIDPAETEFLQLLMSGCCLGKAAAAAASRPEFNLAAALVRMIEAGAFHDIETGEST